ncbi:hypothetical protein AZE42_10343 [Rhizopogon vesiculosus]|uniref:CCHC-type domain-containing protein n=1 Tax=Rhizopogon vesiculosus TaxID=180088 RepID=A0A1J8Q4K0_9AGAM|nr:hypothetical protein AZE42_10343 [Rhizopogon vesiculosus]
MDLCTKFLESKCTSGGDVRQFLDDLCAKRDKLAAVGIINEEKDYRSTIIQSLPNHLGSFASGQLATAHLYSPTQTIDPDILISLIIEESERHTLGDSSSRGHGNGRGGQCGGSNGCGHQHLPCWNCGSREHFKADCKEPDKSADKDSTTVVIKGSAHIVADLDSEDDGVFAVDTLMEPDSDLPDLLTLSDSDSDANRCETYSVNDSDWFSEVGNDENVPWGDDDTFELAAQVSNECAVKPVIELYDSGSMRHISPYCDQFESLTAIPPKSFAAVNKQHFDATGIGEMVIEVPNGVDVSRLRLTEVLFSPEVGYLLVSIGWLDELGYSVTFTDGICTICDPSDDVVGRVPRSSRGLYCIVHECNLDSVNYVVETITIMELHRRMGHIAPSVACCLAENGLVSGVKGGLIFWGEGIL